MGEDESYKMKKVRYRTMSRTIEFEEDEEEVEGKVLGYWVYEVSIMYVVSPHGLVSVSSLGYFLSVVYSSITSNSSFHISLRERHIQDYLEKNRGRKRKLISP